MSAYSKRRLSGSVDGKQILIEETATPGTLIHTAVSGSVDMDEVWLYVTNNHTDAISLTLEFGGVTVPNDLIQLSVPSKTGLYLIIPGFILNNSQVVRAFADVADVACISGWVNRITN